LGLAASGSARRWDVALHESLDADEWSLEIEGPQTYLVFQLRNTGAVAEALRFLESPPSFNSARRRYEGGDQECTLGRFGSAAVSLLWDNEDFLRCFLVIGPKARSTLRLSLDEEDVRMLANALKEVVRTIE
jgi:hypothetical protein